MSRFDDLLNRDLPSKHSGIEGEINSMYEEADDDFSTNDADLEKYMNTECGDSFDEDTDDYDECGFEDSDDDYDECGFEDTDEDYECGLEGCNGEDCRSSFAYEDDLDFDDEDDDVDSFEDELDDDLDSDDEFTGDSISDKLSDMETETFDGEDEEVHDIGPDGEQKIQDTIKAVATPLLIAQECSSEEIEEFLESTDSDIAVEEGYLTEKTIVKLDKQAKKAQLYEVALYTIAREHNDRDYAKLETAWALERKLKERLRRRYDSKARSQANKYMRNLKNATPATVRRVGITMTKNNKKALPGPRKQVKALPVKTKKLA